MSQSAQKSNNEIRQTESAPEYAAGCKWSRDIKILPSMCDEKSRLSIAYLFDVFQNTATLHADNFDIGPDGMNRRNYFWIITKTRAHINRLPSMMEDVVSNTWIQAADRASCERDYSITKGDEMLAYGRSVWAVISRDTGKLVHMSELYPELDFNVAPPDDKPFMKMNRHFEDAETVGEYTVRSVDIDLGGHMNNVNYIRAALGCYTSEQLESFNISEIEVNYISQTYEGETLTFKSKKTAPDESNAGSHIEIGLSIPKERRFSSPPFRNAL